MSADALRQAIESKDRAKYSALLAEDVLFLSPVEEVPQIGREAVSQVLSIVFEIFQDFQYTDQFDGEGTHVLVFRARVGEIPVEGVDLLRMDEQGLVKEFTVMMRPIAGIRTLSKEVGVRIQAARQHARSSTPQ